MTKQTEALKLALEALENYAPKVGGYAIAIIREALAEESSGTEQPGNHYDDVRESMRQAFKQPQQEPFGQVTVRRLSQRFENHSDQYQFYPTGERPYLDNVDECHVVYTSPPAQRKPLTDEEITKCWGQSGGTRHGYVAFARAIEAAHGIKGDA